ncbi:putative aldo-keto reductase [compost metagenome]
MIPKSLTPLLKSVESLKSIAQEHDISIAEMAIRFVNSFDFVDRLVLGLESSEQLSANVSAYKKGPLSSDMIDKIMQVEVLDKKLLNPGSWDLK